jgi:hypothetical protein
LGGFGGGLDTNPAPFGASTEGNMKANVEPFVAGAFDNDKKEYFVLCRALDPELSLLDLPVQFAEGIEVALARRRDFRHLGGLRVGCGALGAFLNRLFGSFWRHSKTESDRPKDVRYLSGNFSTFGADVVLAFLVERKSILPKN